jgi:hypothetical protein
MTTTTKQSRLILFGALFLTLFVLGNLHARGREGYQVKATHRDTGDIIETYNVVVGTTTPVKIFYSTWTQVKNFREIMYQNTSTNSYRLYLGTHSAVSASSGGRWFIPGGGSWTTAAKDDLWAVFESAAFGSGTLEALGQLERDSADADVTSR